MPRRSHVNLQDVIVFLEEHGAGRLAHGPGHTLSDHLRATMKILLHWRQPQDIVIAGLLHSIYSTDIYRQTLVPLSERKHVAAVAGPGAERLVYLFGSIRRNNLFEQLALYDGHLPAAIPVRCHRGNRSMEISANDAAKLLVIYMANTADQVQGTDHSPGVWLSSVSRWAGWAKPLVTRVPPVFDSCSARVSPEDEKAAGASYRAGLTALQESPAAAARAFRTAARRLPWVAEPRVLLSYTALREGRWDNAFYYANSALRRLDEWGAAWDKRLDFPEWKSIAHALMSCAETGLGDPKTAERIFRRRSTAKTSDWAERLKAFPAGAPQGNFKPSAINGSNASPAPPDGLALPPRFLSYLSGFQNPAEATKHNFYPGLRKSPVYPGAGLPSPKRWKPHTARFATSLIARRRLRDFKTRSSASAAPASGMCSCCMSSADASTPTVPAVR